MADQGPEAVHEYQADESTLNNGIDATLYQLLIIEKCVGHKKFALANSFNHCQIKNRIVMMNKQKSNKAWRWKGGGLSTHTCPATDGFRQNSKYFQYIG